METTGCGAVPVMTARQLTTNHPGRVLEAAPVATSRSDTGEVRHVSISPSAVGHRCSRFIPPRPPSALRW